MDVLQFSADDTSKASELARVEDPTKEQHLPNVLPNIQKITVSPGMLAKLKGERIEDESLEVESK